VATTMATKTKRRKSANKAVGKGGNGPAFPGQVVLVLQGGGALGAYQVGVYQALHEAGYRHFNWRDQRCTHSG